MSGLTSYRIVHPLLALLVVLLAHLCEKVKAMSGKHKGLRVRL
jgi:hypothetical protein